MPTVQRAGPKLCQTREVIRGHVQIKNVKA